MKTLTIGIGGAGSTIARLLEKEGLKTERGKLFISYLIDNDPDHLRKLRGIPPERKFHIPHGISMDLLEKKDLVSVVNLVAEEREPFDAIMLVFSLESDFSNMVVVKLAEKLKEIYEEPVFGIAVAPPVDQDSFHVNRIPGKIMNVADVLDSLLIFENLVEDSSVPPHREFRYINFKILNIMNLLAVVGESEYRRREHSEVVIDTSDLFNTLTKGGISVIGFAREKLNRGLFWKWRDQEVRGEKTGRILNLLNRAMSTLSMRCDLSSAESALVIITGPPEEITMDGCLSCVSALESKTPNAEIRWGDFPIPKSRYVSVVVMFSGIRRIG